eukprot:CAMPEP_0198151910 /NCGR_PEP_ID=MMETSP1443-20131203/57675_1 /TAXON_ID=186043 /ORGANISM="Entomoneis sp., Strain CCMP2396" /LENGTH=285 /DNA_ID=CAMNT_0043817757 /DNA_START=128 /DNA_END=985 /DNA_ORIENTATION=+
MKEGDQVKNGRARTVGKSLYLVTDAGFGLQFIICVCTIGVTVGSCWSIPSLRDWVIDLYYFVMDEWIRTTAHQYAMWSLLGLLSSSCCALQLLLNAMSLGCAGLNTVLGPLRPLFLALSISIQLASWYVVAFALSSSSSSTLSWVSTALSTIFVALLSFLPEALTLYTTTSKSSKRGQFSEQVTNKNNSNIIQPVASPTRTSNKINNDLPSSRCYNHKFRMDSVGCAACLTTVHGVLENIPSVVHYKTALDENQVTITCNQAGQEKSILKELEDAGFRMEKYNVE